MTTDSVHSPAESYASPPVTLILSVILLVFFFVGFFSIYFCRCLVENIVCLCYFRHDRAENPSGQTNTNVSPGLDPSIMQTFPTFPYRSVKDLRKEKYGLECAICLSEFGDDDVLRLLTPCCHIFHQDCIDLWLEAHKTCPVCRRNLDEPGKSPEKSPAPTNYSPMHGINEDAPMEDHTFSITITDGDARGGPSEGGTAAAAVPPGAPQSTEKIGGGQKERKKFPRSHSTGHSLMVQTSTKNGEDRFTLRLPENLHANLVRGHNWSRSCTTFGEIITKTPAGNGGFVVVSDFMGGSSRDANKE
ncbi:RING-type E3 ubiquitin transferase [Sarracenia purpurea var. burkii]